MEKGWQLPSFFVVEKVFPSLFYVKVDEKGKGEISYDGGIQKSRGAKKLGRKLTAC